MPERLYLADTSAWILALRKGSAKHPGLEEFKTLLIQRRIVITHPIRLELLTGARTQQEYEGLAQELDSLAVLEISSEVWRESGHLGFILRRKGITVPTVDIIIAATAMFYHSTLYHCDHHYNLISQHVSLKTQSILQKHRR